MTEAAGFDVPQIISDEYVLQLFERMGLGSAPSLREIEPIATGLLGTVATIISGAELVLGRRVDARDPILAQIISPAMTATDRFGVLLLAKVTEKSVASPEDRRATATMKAMSWLSQQRPDLEPYMKAGMYNSVEKDSRIFVQIAINGQRGYEYFKFWVDLKNESIEQV